MAYDPEYRHQYYLKNIEHEKARNKAWRKSKGRSWLDYRAKWQRGNQATKRKLVREVIVAAKDRPCADCGIKYPRYVMDFDHVRGKKSFTIGFAQQRPDLQVILKEISKCDVVCSNCHRVRTFIRRKLME